MKGGKKLFTFVTLAMLLLAGLPSVAQVPTGTISGTVLDPTNLPIAGAEITITNQATGSVFHAKTNDSGAFLVPSLMVGTYKIEVKATGFRTSVVSQVKLDAGTQNSVPPIKLELGEVTETVTVEAATSTVQTANAQIVDTVERKQIEALPLFNRSPLALLGLQAGVNQNARTVTVINGQRPSLSNVTMDGINIQDNFIRSNSLDFLPNLPLLGQVAEFTVTTSNSGAESGLGASQVNIVTPSGTNEWHAEGFWYHRNGVLAANSWFNNAAGTKRPFLLLNQAGGNVGGPIFKKKLFIYGWYELFRQRQQSSQNHTILTDPARTGVLTFIPTCTTACPVGVTAGQPQTFNVLAAHTSAAGPVVGPFPIDPLIVALLARVPTQSVINNFLAGDSTANQLLNTAGFSFNKAANRTRDNYGIKGDWDVTAKHSVSGTWAWNRDIVDRNDLDTTYNTVPIVTNNDVKRLVSGTWRWTPTSAFTNQLTAGFNLAPATFITARDFGSANVYTGFNFTNPDVTFRSQGRDTNTYTIQDNASWARGKHFIRFGYQSQFIRSVPFNDAGINAGFSIGLSAVNPNGLIAGNFAAQGGISAANLSTANSLLATLAGFLTSGSQTFNVTSKTSGYVPNATSTRKLRFDTHAFYAGDSWRLRSNLTFNYGVRWEYLGRFTNADGLFLLPVIPSGATAFQTLMSNATLDFAGGPTGRPLHNPDRNNFAPNISIAWDPFGEGKTSVRAGYSVHFVNDESIRSGDNAALGNAGLQTSVSVANLNVSMSGAVPTITAPAFFVPRTVANNNTANNGIPTTVFTVDPNLRAPYVQEWNLGVQHEVGWNTVIDVRYVGNKGTKLYRGIDFNQVEIFSNGFFDDFMRARSNGFIALNTPLTFPGCTSTTCATFNPAFNALLPGSQPLTVIPLVGGGGSLTSSGTRTAIQTGAVGDLAGIYHLNDGVVDGVQLVPNPTAGVADLVLNYSNSSYNAGVVEVRRRFTKGLGIQANYTFSKVLTDSDGTGQTKFDPFLDNNNPKRDRARATFDITHAFKANFVYELPVGRGHRLSSNNSVLDRVLTGWTIGSVFTWQSGNPISILSGRGTLNRSGRSGRNTAVSRLTASQLASFVGLYKVPGSVYVISPTVISQSGSTLGRGVGLDTLAPCNFTGFTGQVFCNPEPGQLGNIQTLAFNGPSLFAWDFSVYKQTSITESLKFEYRAEFFNILNHPVFFSGDQSINSSSFGKLSSVAVTSRRIQMTVRLIW